MYYAASNVLTEDEVLLWVKENSCKQFEQVIHTVVFHSNFHFKR